MPNYILSPNMSLPVPVVGTQTGPAWAQNLDACMSTIDSHTHAPGSGVPVTPLGIQINSDLAFGANNATGLRATRFSSQSSPIPNTGSDIGELYVAGNELYYNDVTGGNQVKITSNGSVTGSSGTITGLPSGTASASFQSASGTFVFQQSTSTGANLDIASLIVRYPGSYPTPSGNYIQLQAPISLSSGYSLTLPAIPASKSFLALDTSGNISGYASINQGISRSNLVAVGQQVSSSCGSFLTSSATPVSVTNLSVTITTSGRPVIIALIPDGTAGAQMGMGNNSGAPAGTFYVLCLRGIVTISTSQYFNAALTTSGAALFPPPGVLFIDTPTSGTYTYSIKAEIASGNSSFGVIDNCVLFAYEL
jgi:hypothetical protein